MMHNLISHFLTITIHKYRVMRLCFQCGLYKQGILHDLSKYSLIEFIPGVKYYQGYRSPISKEKEVKGFSEGWLHHKGRNKHHWEYWIDHTKQGVTPIQMPIRYVAEMICDRIAASKTYLKDNYHDGAPLQYFHNEGRYVTMHPNTKQLTQHLLEYLQEHGEQNLLSYMKKLIKKHNTSHEKT